MRRRRSVLAIFGVVYVLLLAGLGWWMDRRFRSVSVEAVAGSVWLIGREIATALEAGSEPVLPVDDAARARVKAMLSELTESSQSLQSLDVVAVDGTILASDDRGLVGTRVAPAHVVLTARGGTRLVEPRQTLTPEAVYDLYLPLRRDGETAGYLRMGIASEVLAQLYAHHRTQMLLAALIGLVGILFVSVLLQHQFTVHGAVAARAIEEMLTGRVTLPAVRGGPFARVFEEAGRLAQVLRDEGGMKNAATAKQVVRLTQLHAALAHELKAPLHAIVLNIDLLERAIARSVESARSDGSRYLGVIKGEMGRLERAVGALGAVDSPHAEWEVVLLSDVVTGIADLLRPQAQAQRVVLEVEAVTAAHVDGVRDQLKQAVLNIAQNALEAMPDGGRLGLSVSPSGDGFALAIEDTGTGLSAEFLDQIGTRPTTTKATGMGVGLYLARAIVEAHGGRVDVTSQLGKGTRCEMLLPRTRCEV